MAGHRAGLNFSSRRNQGPPSNRATFLFVGPGRTQSRKLIFGTAGGFRDCDRRRWNETLTNLAPRRAPCSAALRRANTPDARHGAWRIVCCPRWGDILNVLTLRRFWIASAAGRFRSPAVYASGVAAVCPGLCGDVAGWQAGGRWLPASRGFCARHGSAICGGPDELLAKDLAFFQNIFGRGR